MKLDQGGLTRNIHPHLFEITLPKDEPDAILPSLRLYISGVKVLPLPVQLVSQPLMYS